MIPAAPNQWEKVILALPFRPLYDNMSLLSLLHFLRGHTHSFIVVISCYKSSGSILNFFELILKAYTRGAPNRTAIFQDWAHQSFVCCLFYLLWTRHTGKTGTDPWDGMDSDSDLTLFIEVMPLIKVLLKVNGKSRCTWFPSVLNHHTSVFTFRAFGFILSCQSVGQYALLNPND